MNALLNLLMDNPMVIAGGAVGGFLGLLVSRRELGKIFRMLRTSTSEIGSLQADEQVEVVGKAESQTALQSPITKTPCVFWQVVISEKRSSGKSARWVVVQSESSTASFDVSDGTGRMSVHPSRGLELLLRDDVTKASGVFNSLDEQTQAVLNEMGVNTQGFLNLNRTLAVHERYIEQGDEIYLMGRTSANLGGKVLDVENFPLIISDHSELRLVSKFIWQVLMNSLIGVFLGGMVSFYFINRNIRLPWSN